MKNTEDEFQDTPKNYRMKVTSNLLTLEPLNENGDDKTFEFALEE